MQKENEQQLIGVFSSFDEEAVTKCIFVNYNLFFLRKSLESKNCSICLLFARKIFNKNAKFGVVNRNHKWKILFFKKITIATITSAMCTFQLILQ